MAGKKQYMPTFADAITYLQRMQKNYHLQESIINSGYVGVRALFVALTGTDDTKSRRRYLTRLDITPQLINMPFGGTRYFVTIDETIKIIRYITSVRDSGGRALSDTALTVLDVLSDTRTIADDEADLAEMLKELVLLYRARKAARKLQEVV